MAWLLPAVVPLSLQLAVAGCRRSSHGAATRAPVVVYGAAMSGAGLDARGAGWCSTSRAGGAEPAQVQVHLRVAALAG